MQKTRWILQTLILSAALNVALLSIFFYFLIRDNPLHFAYKPKEEVFCEPPPITPTLLGRLHAFSFAELVELLKDQRKLEYGYRVRDFALSALASFHEFDVERALGRGELSKRRWESLGNSFLLFPSLSDEDFDKLQNFAKKEKWPFTAKGLFKALRKNGIEMSDPELIGYFCHTPHFVFLETLFARTNLRFKKRNILALASENSWDQLERFWLQQQENRDFSQHTRQVFLMDAIEAGSKTAAYLLLITDFDFAIQQLEDAQVVKVLDLLTVQTQEALHFATQIAASCRGDEVQQRAMQRLAEYTHKPLKEIAGHFYEKPHQKHLRPLFREAPPAAPDPSVHIIQPGESLWLIAKKYQLPLEVLMEANHLQSTLIQPGKTLKIPLH
jgi:hypothetical protein